MEADEDEGMKDRPGRFNLPGNRVFRVE